MCSTILPKLEIDPKEVDSVILNYQPYNIILPHKNMKYIKNGKWDIFSKVFNYIHPIIYRKKKDNTILCDSIYNPIVNI